MGWWFGHPGPHPERRQVGSGCAKQKESPGCQHPRMCAQQRNSDPMCSQDVCCTGKASWYQPIEGWGGSPLLEQPKDCGWLHGGRLRLGSQKNVEIDQTKGKPTRPFIGHSISNHWSIFVFILPKFNMSFVIFSIFKISKIRSVLLAQDRDFQDLVLIANPDSQARPSMAYKNDMYLLVGPIENWHPKRLVAFPKNVATGHCQRIEPEAQSRSYWRWTGAVVFNRVLQKPILNHVDIFNLNWLTVNLIWEPCSNETRRMVPMTMDMEVTLMCP